MRIMQSFAECFFGSFAILFGYEVFDRGAINADEEERDEIVNRVDCYESRGRSYNT